MQPLWAAASGRFLGWRDGLAWRDGSGQLIGYFRPAYSENEIAEGTVSDDEQYYLAYLLDGASAGETLDSTNGPEWLGRMTNTTLGSDRNEAPELDAPGFVPASLPDREGLGLRHLLDPAG